MQFELGFAYTHLLDGNRGSETTTFADGSRSRFTWSYDGLGRLTGEVYDADVVANGEPDSYADTYTFDLLSNRATRVRTDASGTSTTAYAYDANDRLRIEAVDAPGSESDRFTEHLWGTDGTATT